MIFLDTNAVIALMKPASPTIRIRYRQALAARQSIVVSSIVLFEFHYGISLSARRRDNMDQLVHFLDGPIETLPFEPEDAIVAGEVRAALKIAGTPIGPYDLLIAGQALRHGATLVTANTQEFERIRGLKVEDWARP